jgi:hypothetical protein
MLILTRKVGARIAFVVRAAVNPSMDAVGKTSCFPHLGKLTSIRLRCAPGYSILLSAATRDGRAFGAKGAR